MVVSTSLGISSLVLIWVVSGVNRFLLVLDNWCMNQFLGLALLHIEVVGLRSFKCIFKECCIYKLHGKLIIFFSILTFNVLESAGEFLELGFLSGEVVA